MTTMNEMPLPDWAPELAQKSAELHQKTQLKSVGFKELQPVTHFTTFFAEWEFKNGDLLIHLFPRAGEADQWTEGYYLNKCKACRRDVPPVRDHRQFVRCPHCKRTSGLIYVPSRREEPPEGCSFPSNMEQIVKSSVDSVWFGDASVDLVPELCAWAVKFIRAAGVQSVDEEGGLLDRFLSKIDSVLDAR
jgi:hypothetical protein